MAKATKAKADDIPVLRVGIPEGETPQQTSARIALAPAVTAGRFLADLNKNALPDVDLSHFVEELRKQGDAVKGGNLSRLEEMLTAQAHALDGLFYSMVHRSRANQAAGYPDAAATYMKLGLRAQSQCRATAESLAAIKNPAPVAFVRQANISAGPQQVNNGVALPRPSRAGEIETTPSKLLEVEHGQRLDFGAPGTASGANPQLETVGTLDRTQVGTG